MGEPFMNFSTISEIVLSIAKDLAAPFKHRPTAHQRNVALGVATATDPRKKPALGVPFTEAIPLGQVARLEGDGPLVWANGSFCSENDVCITIHGPGGEKRRYRVAAKQQIRVVAGMLLLPPCADS